MFNSVSERKKKKWMRGLERKGLNERRQQIKFVKIESQSRYETSFKDEKELYGSGCISMYDDEDLDENFIMDQEL